MSEVGAQRTWPSHPDDERRPAESTTLGQPPRMACGPDRRLFGGRDWLPLAGTGASERQPTGIVNLDDGFQAASSPDWLSSLDPHTTLTNLDPRPKS